MGVVRQKHLKKSCYLGAPLLSIRACLHQTKAACTGDSGVPRHDFRALAIAKPKQDARVYKMPGQVVIRIRL